MSFVVDTKGGGYSSYQAHPAQKHLKTKRNEKKSKAAERSNLASIEQSSPQEVQHNNVGLLAVQQNRASLQIGPQDSVSPQTIHQGFCSPPTKQQYVASPEEEQKDVDCFQEEQQNVEGVEEEEQPENEVSEWDQLSGEEFKKGREDYEEPGSDYNIDNFLKEKKKILDDRTKIIEDLKSQIANLRQFSECYRVTEMYKLLRELELKLLELGDDIINYHLNALKNRLKVERDDLIRANPQQYSLRIGKLNAEIEQIRALQRRYKLPTKVKVMTAAYSAGSSVGSSIAWGAAKAGEFVASNIAWGATMASDYVASSATKAKNYVTSQMFPDPE